MLDKPHLLKRRYMNRFRIGSGLPPDLVHSSDALCGSMDTELQPVCYGPHGEIVRGRILLTN